MPTDVEQGVRIFVLAFQHSMLSMSIREQQSMEKCKQQSKVRILGF